MNTRRLAAVITLAATTLVGCAAIPHTGDVQEGSADVLPVEPLQPIQEGPGPSDEPAAIIVGFLNASAAGVASDFEVAREFLTDEAAASWNPGAQTLVYRSGAATPVWDEESRTVAYEVPLSSTVDSSGRRVDSPDGTVADLSYTLIEDDQGRWRISELADGVVINQANFTRFFRQVDLVFATPDLTTSVPEVRWLPDNNVVTAAARELVEGPSTWLADAVVTGFPATAALAVESVVVTGGVATVDLTPQSAGTPEQRALAAEQMRVTLGAMPSVTDVEVRIGGLPIATDEPVELTAPPVPEPQAAVLAAGRLGTWDGETLLMTADDVGGVGANAYGLARSYDGERVAYVDGEALMTSTVLAEDGASFVAFEQDMPAPVGTVAATDVFSGSDLVAPSFDRHGYLWTARGVDGEGLIAVAPTGESVVLESAWLQTRSTIALSVSRDGSMVATVSRSGGQPVVEVAAVVRDAAGAPLGIGEPVAIGTGVGAGVDLAWLDDSTVAVLGEDVEGASSPLWLVTVGGGTSLVTTLQDAVDLSVRVGEASLVVVGADGRVEERSGSAWAPVLQGVSEVAYSG
ncbi:GerMN domain-containing protein [Demequina aestuarii]|uniref:GerMN domain-containing protein n=1 Tax=Demequina aestuarii TaxID=327095 RepID=UPI000780D55B|nr:LpqB family beta-propeller domain-containing protein [Demequina aestuarii]